MGVAKSKIYFQKTTEILKGRGVQDYGISEGEGGLKLGSCPWLGMDIFWNCPLSASVSPWELLSTLGKAFCRIC